MSSFPFQKSLAKQKKDGDDDDGAQGRQIIAREGDPLLPGGGGGTSSISQSAAGYRTLTSSSSYLEDSQQLRSRRTTSKSPPIDSRHSSRGGGRGRGAATIMNNEPFAAASASASHDDDEDDNEDSDQESGADSLAQQLQQQLREDQQQLLLLPQHHSIMSTSLSPATTVTMPALPAGGGNDHYHHHRDDHGGDGDGDSASTTSKSSSYQHAINDFLSGDDSTTNTAAAQQSVSTTGNTTTATDGAGTAGTTATHSPAGAAGQFQQYSYHQTPRRDGMGFDDDHNAPTREDDHDRGGDAGSYTADDDDRYISSTSNSLSQKSSQHSAYSSLPSLPTTTHHNAAATSGGGASTNTASTSAASVASLSHQTPMSSAASASVTSPSIQQQQQQSGGGGYQIPPPSKQQQQHQHQQQQQQYQQQQQQQQQQQYHAGASSFPRASSPLGGDDSRSVGSSGSQNPPLLEIPEEIYAVRKAALKVLKPLTKTWIVIAVGCSMTVLFGMARWTRLLPGIPFWFILLPSWSAHVGLLWLHILSARALSTFIAEANDSRQRPDSRDQLNRTEYLPLLQRSLKFGLKTGLLSFFVFIFEILIFIRLSRGSHSMSLNAAFIPLWILISGCILDGFICRTQHFLRVICWLLSFAAMVLLVLKVDYDCNAIRWRVVVSPVVAVLSIASANLIYIVYGHQIGYYRLTEAQLTAGNLYSLAALICIILVVMIGEVIPLSRPVEVETRLFVVILAPLVVCLVSMGAWVVSRDEFGRLLLYGGQAAVHPMKLRWESKGWTSVQGKGVTVIPMFGEVSFRPLERRPRHGHGGSSDNSGRHNNGRIRRNQKSPTDRFVELCVCCSCGGQCYPYEAEEEDVENSGGSGSAADDIGYHPYLDPSPSRSARHLHGM